MLRITMPNKGSLPEAAVETLKEADCPGRDDSKSLTIHDEANDTEFFFLRPKDIPIYVGNGHLGLGITGRDLAIDSMAPVDEVLNLGFGASTFCYTASVDEEWTVEALEGKRIVTSYPNLAQEDLKARDINVTVIRLDGAVGISIRLGVANVIADVIPTGRTLRKQGLKSFGDVLVSSEAVVVGRKGVEATEEQQVFLRRMTGVLHARTYLMIDYNTRVSALGEAPKLILGLLGSTVLPLTNEDWVAVHALVPKTEANSLMDTLVKIGAEAILASNIRIARIQSLGLVAQSQLRVFSSGMPSCSGDSYTGLVAY